MQAIISLIIVLKNHRFFRNMKVTATFSSFVLASLASLALSGFGVSAHDSHDHHTHQHGGNSCTTKTPPPEELAQLNADIEAFKRRRSSGFTAKQSIIVPVYFVM
jgi:hypothetical protein